MKSPPIDHTLIEAQVAKLLNSETFGDASRLQQFLRYVVQSYCQGKAREISQYSIGVEAFGFNDQFDPQQSSVVRMEAGRLRRRLSLYYATEGVKDQLIIEIPKGSYIPVITSRDAEPAPLEPVLARQKDVSKKRSHVDHPNLRVAVVPFQNISGDDQLDYFADGLSEEITSVLSLYKDFSVVPPIATRNLSGEQINLGEIARIYQARYVLDASIRKAKDLVRIIVRLSDTSENSLLWANTYDTSLEVDNLISIQEEMAASVTNSIANEYDGIIPQKVASELKNKDPITISTYEATLHIHHYNLSQSPAQVYDDTLKAIQYALERDSDNPMLLSVLVELKLDGYAQGWSDAQSLPVDECQLLLDKAISSDPKCGYAYFVQGLLHTNQRNRAKLYSSIDQLLTFKHNVSYQAMAGWFMALAGDYDNGTPLLRQCLEQMQFYPGWFRHALFLFHYQHGRYEEALTEASRMNMPGLLWDPVDRAAALGKLGRYDEGSKAIGELLKLYPNFFDNPKRYLEMFILEDDLLDEVIQGLELNRK